MIKIVVGCPVLYGLSHCKHWSYKFVISRIVIQFCFFTYWINWLFCCRVTLCKVFATSNNNWLCFLRILIVRKVETTCGIQNISCFWIFTCFWGYLLKPASYALFLLIVYAPARRPVRLVDKQLHFMQIHSADDITIYWTARVFSHSANLWTVPLVEWAFVIIDTCLTKQLTLVFFMRYVLEICRCEMSISLVFAKRVIGPWSCNLSFSLVLLLLWWWGSPEKFQSQEQKWS